MIDEILQRRPKRSVDLNIVPILDMLTTVIFFLLMSTSFIEYTKLTVPPARSVVSRAGAGSVPLNPKLFVTENNGTYQVKLVWHGKEPGEGTVQADATNIEVKLKTLLKSFATSYPTEKTLQVAMDQTVRYQTLISVMDAARDLLPDVVLLSYREVNAHE